MTNARLHACLLVHDVETRGNVYEVNCNAPIDAVHLEIERHVAKVLGVEDKAVQEQLGRR